jgi:signal transduction histidine kinase
MLGNLELLDLAKLPSDEHERLHTVHRAARELASTVDGLMELAASEGRPFEPMLSERPLLEVLDAVEARWQRRLAAKGQLLLTELVGGDDDVTADWGRLDQVADRLLDNVEGHARPGVVTVCLGHADGLLTLTIADSGPGFPPELRDEVLLPFVRLDASPWSSKAGIGIGLAVAVRLLEGAGGMLRIEPSEQGTVATAVMPRQRRVQTRA